MCAIPKAIDLVCLLRRHWLSRQYGGILLKKGQIGQITCVHKIMVVFSIRDEKFIHSFWKKRFVFLIFFSKIENKYIYTMFPRGMELFMTFPLPSPLTSRVCCAAIGLAANMAELY
jgi:hypothetical protein